MKTKKTENGQKRPKIVEIWLDIVTKSTFKRPINCIKV